jgi:hypothetical protein
MRTGRPMHEFLSILSPPVFLDFRVLDFGV